MGRKVYNKVSKTGCLETDRMCLGVTERQGEEQFIEGGPNASIFQRREEDA
jgi:hypothetical protein